MKNTTEICLEKTSIKDIKNLYTHNDITELSYNAKFTYFKHRAKIESLRFFIV